MKTKAVTLTSSDSSVPFYEAVSTRPIFLSRERDKTTLPMKEELVKRLSLSCKCKLPYSKRALTLSKRKTAVCAIIIFEIDQ